LHGRAHDIFLSRVNTPPLTRTRSPFTVSSRASSRHTMGTPSAAQLADENRYLNDELNRVETVLNSTRAEKDEISIRYNAISDRVSFFVISKISLIVILYLFNEDLVK
jgi:succinylglutamate desuccinylase